MVTDEHNVTHLERGIHAARRIRKNQGFHPKTRQNLLRISHHVHRIAFVIMESTTENEHLHAIKPTENHAPFMSLHRGKRKIGDILVRNLIHNINSIRQAAQTGAQYDGDFRIYRFTVVQVLNRFFNSFSLFL